MELCHIQTDVWQNKYKDFSEDTDYFPDGPPECPFDVKYKIDKDLHRVKEHSH